MPTNGASSTVCNITGGMKMDVDDNGHKDCSMIFAALISKQLQTNQTQNIDKQRFG